MLEPKAEDYFILKTKHSVFYETGLDLLLRYLKTENLIFTGITTDNCIHYSVADAYMRDLNIYIPSDCTAAFTAATETKSLNTMENLFKAQTSKSKTIMSKIKMATSRKSKKV